MENPTIHEDRRFFIKQIATCIAGVGSMSLLPDVLLSDEIVRKGLPRSFPEAQGISSAEIMRFVEMAEKLNAGLHSFMIIRHGYVVAEGWWAPYKADINHYLYSLSKNVTSTAIGFALQEGKLRVKDKVISFFPKELPEVVDPKLAAMTVWDLLTMSSGHAKDTLRPILVSKDPNWIKSFLNMPITYKPGTHFTYNGGCTYMLSAIVQKVTGQTMMDYLEPRLFSPLDIKSAAWDSDPQGINLGASGLRLKTEDIAKFGQLYLQKGLWKGKRILNEKWIHEATSFQISNHDTGTPTKREEDDIKQGYGYQFWLSRPQGQGAYRAEGGFCQFSIIVPKHDAVIAITAEGISTNRVMNLCWDILLPAMKPATLPADKTARRALENKLKALKLVAPKSKPESPIAASNSEKKYAIENNSMNIQNISFRFEKSGTTFTLQDDKGEYKIICGIEDWKTGKTNMPGSPTNLVIGVPLFQNVWKVAASGTWKDEKTFIMTWLFFESPHSDIVTCKFENDELRIQYANSITRILKDHHDPRPILEGKLVV